MEIARVFARKTKATPLDSLCFYEIPNRFQQEGLPIKEVHVSVTFTYDIEKGNRLAEAWSRHYEVKIGGPAFKQPGEEFIPGRYLALGNTITSRGCYNKCWFCSVWKREKGLRELVIHEGNNVRDDNLLACSEKHIRDVFSMLKTQKYGRPIFSGGLEAKLLKPWHIELLHSVKPERMYFAFDTADDYEPLLEAGKLLTGFNIRQKNCYVLIGYPKDSFEKAEKRLTNTLKAGYMPFAMLYKDDQGREDHEWRKFQREWCRPAIVYSKFKQLFFKG